MMTEQESVSAFAPATTSNLAVGFDILGFPLEQVGDSVLLQKRTDDKLIIQSINADITSNSLENTATVAIQSMLDTLGSKQGFDVRIDKGIPLGSGLGGSAASAVAAVVALNHLLKEPLSLAELVPHALAGEYAATNALHGDNIIPCLYGGMTLVSSLDPLQVIQLPILDIVTVFVRPDVQVNTKDARAALSSSVLLTAYIRQNARTAAFIHALHTNDLDLLASVCQDDLIEPMRAHLIPFFYEVKQAAYDGGALASSISGAGPTVFAFARNVADASTIKDRMCAVYQQQNMAVDAWVSNIAVQGARIVT